MVLLQANFAVAASLISLLGRAHGQGQPAPACHHGYVRNRLLHIHSTQANNNIILLWRASTPKGRGEAAACGSQRTHPIPASRANPTTYIHTHWALR